MSIYLELTREFNVGRLRAIISSGPAVVLLRLAIASKDGDWIVREDQEALGHVLGVLERERFAAMDADDRRLRAYLAATPGLEKAWPEIQRETVGLPLRKAHAILVDSALRCLPTSPGAIPPATSS